MLFLQPLFYSIPQLSVKSLKKHYDIAASISGLPCALQLPKLNAAQRENLIASHVPFVSGQQVYLPFWGCVFSERGLNVKEPVEIMTATTQVVFLSIYYQLAEGEKSNSTQLVERLGMPKSSLSRAVQDLKAMGFIVIKPEGTTNWIYLNGTPEEVIANGLGYMQNPVSKKLYLKSVPADLPYKLGGLKALSELSMLGTNDRDGAIVYSRKSAATISKDLLISKRDFDDFGGTIAECWRYDPFLLSDRNTVDDISLLMCLKDDEDERVQKELDCIRNNHGLSMEDD